MLADGLTIILSALGSYILLVESSSYVSEFYLFAAGFVVFSSVLLMRSGGLYQTGAMLSVWRALRAITVSIITASAFLLTILHALKTEALYQADWLIAFPVLSIVGLVSMRALTSLILSDLLRKGRIGRRTAVFGTGLIAKRFLEQFTAHKPGLSAVTAFYVPSTPLTDPMACPHPTAGGLQDLLRTARLQAFDDIVIALPDSEAALRSEAIEKLRELPVDVYLAPQYSEFGFRFRPVRHQENLPMFEVWQRPISGWGSYLKLAEDYLLASVALLLLLPVLVVIGVAIRMDSPGPVLFRQKRLGFNNQEFEIFKFRTMRQRDRAEVNVVQATRDDPRITRIGRFLRRTSLDELPQLLNVLNGTMSLVGPRPHALSHNADFSHVVRGYFGRHKVKPGITGWAQVNGLRGEIDCHDKLKARIAHDVHYAENWSIFFDLRILFTTAFVVLFQKNAY